MMKYFAFSNTKLGFQDWLHSIWRMKSEIEAYCRTQSYEFKEYIYPRYKEARNEYQKYLDFRKLLGEDEIFYIESIMKHKVPTFITFNIIDAVFTKWSTFMFDIHHGFIKDISNEEVGQAIINARKELCLNRRQVAEIIGISYNALKMYEEGKRTLPFNVYYKLSQILNIIS